MLGVSSEVVFDVLVNVSKLGHQLSLFVLIHSALDGSVDAVTFLDVLLERLEATEVSELVNLTLNLVISAFHGVLLLKVSLVGVTGLLGFECLFFTSLAFHLLVDKVVLLHLGVQLLSEHGTKSLLATTHKLLGNLGLLSVVMISLLVDFRINFLELFFTL